jgi:DNA-binding MarR family transcriptional regulator
MSKSSKTAGPPNLQHTGREPHILREVMLTYQAILSDFSRVIGMPAARFGILRIVAVSYPELLGPMEIARRLGVNAAAITRQLHEMEADGLIIRAGSASDARRRHVELTVHGRETFERLHRRNHYFEDQLRPICSDQDLSSAVKVLAEIRTIISSLASGGQL